MLAHALNLLSHQTLPHFIDLMSLAVLNEHFAPYIKNASTCVDTTHFVVNDPNVVRSESKITTPPEEVIKNIQYSHIPGLILHQAEMKNGSSFQTAAGINVTITMGMNGVIWVNDARITRSDLLVSNGVAHVIDRVLNANRPDARPHWREVMGIDLDHDEPTDLHHTAKMGIIIGVGIFTFVFCCTFIVLHCRHRARPKKPRNRLTRTKKEKRIKNYHKAEASRPQPRRNVESHFGELTNGLSSLHELYWAVPEPVEVDGNPVHELPVARA